MLTFLLFMMTFLKRLMTFLKKVINLFGVLQHVLTISYAHIRRQSTTKQLLTSFTLHRLLAFAIGLKQTYMIEVGEQHIHVTHIGSF